MSINEKTDLGHWELTWAARPRCSFPSGIDTGTRNVLRLLRAYLRPGLRYVEIGCAPGKVLSWVGREINAPVSGIDYSPTGVETARWLCSKLKIKADIRCEDATCTTFGAHGFDLVFSCGLIEHFDDPRRMVEAHVDLIAPGGVAVIAVPNYSGLYLKLQSWCDQANLDIHNLKIMNETAMVKIAPVDSDLFVRSFRYGRFSPWLISLSAKLGVFGKLISWVLNMLALLQPVDVPWLCPLVVLEVRRRSSEGVPGVLAGKA